MFGILNDAQIREYCKEGMLTPYSPERVCKNEEGNPTISSGMSPFGYDVTLNEKIKIMISHRRAFVIDPKDPNTLETLMVSPDIHTDNKGCRYFEMQPGSFALARCNEAFNMPPNVVALLMTKSTYARAAVSVKTTPIQPGFKGDVVLEIKNDAVLPVRVYIDEGIAHLWFFAGELPEVGYDGVYQNQSGVTLPRV